MSKTKFVKPKHGFKVPHPTTGVFLSEEGEVVEWNSYFQRRVDADEIEVSEEPKASEEVVSSDEEALETNEIEEDKVEEDKNEEDSQGGH